MENSQPSVEELINMVLTDIQQKGYSAIQPFDIGEVEQRMLEFAEVNDITLGSDRLYMSAKQLQHCMRPSKDAKRTTKTRKSNGRYFVKETKRQGRIAHHHTDATVPHIVALLGSTFHAAKIRSIFESSKF